MPTRSDVTVINSAYDTSGNGGRKIVRLSNGWLVLGVHDGNDARFFVSQNNGSTFTQLCTDTALTSTTTGKGLSLVSIGTKVYYILQDAGTSPLYLYSNYFDATTVTNVDQSSNGKKVQLDGQTSYDAVSLIANDTGTELHAAWSSKNATYPNSFNIRYVKGTINADGSVTWGTVEQWTTVNTSGLNLMNPTITYVVNRPIVVCENLNSNGGANTAITALSPSGLANAPTGTFAKYYTHIYTVVNTYAQSSPSAIFVPQSINGLANGRIWVTWHGTDSTDTASNNIRYSYSDDGGVTWLAMAKITTGNTIINQGVTVTASKNGDIHFLWHAAASGGYYNVKKVKYSASAFGTITQITNNTTAHAQNPSSLFDLTVNFAEPLFVYQNVQTAKVGFYGTWTVTTISVTPGAIGTKTSADKSNFLTYTITTDGTMSTITEKVNGAVVGTKTATSGQSQIAGLTQAQWDAVKFGKYADATGGLNTITVEMGSDVWTYTFDKRLATNEDIAQAVKATQDTQTTYLPSVKTKLASAITSKGGTASGSDSFDTLVSAVNGLGGARMATGTATSSVGSVSFTHVNGATATFNTLTVTGLSFKPTFIYAIFVSGVNTYYTIYSEISGDTYPKVIKLAQVTQGSGSLSTYHIKGDVSPVNIVNGSFTIPMVVSNGTCTWIAFG